MESTGGRCPIHPDRGILSGCCEVIVNEGGEPIAITPQLSLCPAPGPDGELPRCDPDVFARGSVVGVFTFGGPPQEKYTAEALCAALAGFTGWKWDWNFAGGRVVLRCLKP